MSRTQHPRGYGKLLQKMPRFETKEALRRYEMGCRHGLEIRTGVHVGSVKPFNVNPVWFDQHDKVKVTPVRVQPVLSNTRPIPAVRVTTRMFHREDAVRIGRVLR